MRSRWIGLVALLAMWVFALAVFGRLPERIPTHWNLQGEVDGWSPKRWAAFLNPALATALLPLLWWVLPRVGPRRENFARFAGEVVLFGNVLALFLLYVEVLTLGAALGWPVDVGGLTLAGVGLLFVTLGNYLPRIRSNWWMGIRTPWTLDSERVWRDTHRVGGRAFVIGGLLATAAALLPDPARAWLSVAALAGAALFPVAYSYFDWRREARGRSA